MKRARRFSTTRIIVVVLTFAALNMILVMAGLVLLVTKSSAPTAITILVAPYAGMVVTAVPTVAHISSPLPPPIQTIQPALDSLAEGSLSVQSAVPPIIPGPLVDPALSLFTAPVDVPLEIQIPALSITSPVIGVGLTLTNAMAAPRGIGIDDPLWQTIFWYRGGGIPGDIGTATFAGHFDDALGRPAVFAFLAELQIGDLIIVHDKRSGLNIPFITTEMTRYTNQESADPAILARIFGSSAIDSTELSPVSEPISRLTLITCAGAWIDGTFDLRLVVYANRANYPL